MPRWAECERVQHSAGSKPLPGSTARHYFLLEVLPRQLTYAGVAELVYALALGASSCKGLEVRVLSPAPNFYLAMEPLFIISGIVTPSSQRGRTLGFPTANLLVPLEEIQDGIYIALTKKDNRVYPSLLFIGSALTFGETGRKMEVYILDKVDDWYGEEILVESLKKIRENKKFDSADALVSQMKLDEQTAREFFESSPQPE